MTLSEKNERQKVVVRDMFSFVIEKKENTPQNLRLFEEKIEELFNIEMEYYGAKVTTLDGDGDIYIDFPPDNNKNDIASFENSGTFMGKYFPAAIHVKITKTFLEIFNDNPIYRIQSCGILIYLLFHEMRHFRQYELAESNVCSYSNLQNAKELLVQKFENGLFYAVNHNRFTYEADARVMGQYSANDIGVNLNVPYLIAEAKADREISFVLTQKDGIVDKHRFIQILTEGLVSGAPNLHSFQFYGMLSKVFNDDCTPKTLSQIFATYNEELHKIEPHIYGADVSKGLIDDVNEMFYSIFLDRLLFSDTFELYHAAKDHGCYEIYWFLNHIWDYNLKQRNKKQNLIEDRLNAFKSGGTSVIHTEKNCGFVADPTNDFQSSINVLELVDKLGLSHEDSRINDFLRSDDFTCRLPIHGFFISKLGNALSIKDFTNDILIPKLEVIIDRPEEFNSLYLDTLKEKVVSSCEMDCSVCRLLLRQETETNMELIMEYEELVDNNTFEEYNPSIVDGMELVHMICDKKVSPLNEFNKLVVRKENESEKEFLARRVEWINSLSTYAVTLNSDELFNRSHKDYVTLLNNNDEFRSLNESVNNEYNAYLKETDDPDTPMTM